MPDTNFDRFLPPELHAVSWIYWTPLDAAARAAQWLRELRVRTVVDIGSGVGKFCIAAALGSSCSFTGRNARRESQQRVLDRWQQQFNHVRPHQALGGKTPAEVYTPSARRFLDCLPYVYPDHFLVTKVTHRGMLYMSRSSQYFLSGSLVGHHVGIETIDEFHVRAWFRDLDLGIVEIDPQVDEAIFDRKPSPGISKGAA